MSEDWVGFPPGTRVCGRLPRLSAPVSAHNDGDDLDRSTGMIQVFRQREGHWPTSWQALALDQPPTDPLGHPCALDGEAGRVELARSSPLGPLPTRRRPPDGRSP